MSGIQQLLFATKGQAGLQGVVTLTDQSAASYGNNNALRLGYELGSNGKASIAPLSTVGAGNVFEHWVDPLGAAGLFEVYTQVISGGPVNGTLGAWLPLTTSHQWYIVANTTINQSVTAKFAVTVRRVGQTTPEATAYIELIVRRNASI
jgi:hypothetical protein